MEIRDPGELLAYSDAMALYAGREAASRERDRLVGARDAASRALAALDAVLALIPHEEEVVAEEAFTTAAGRAVRAADPARFHGGYLRARREHLRAQAHAISRRLGELADPAFHARTLTLAADVVGALRMPDTLDRTSRSLLPVEFAATEDPRHPYATWVEGAHWRVRVNEFPESEFVYSLLIDGAVVEELQTWPAAWRRPGV